MAHGSFRGAARAMAAPGVKSPERAWVAEVKAGILLFTGRKFGKVGVKTTGLDLNMESPVVKSALTNKRKVKDVVKTLLSKNLSEIKTMSGFQFTADLIKEAFGPLADSFFPDVWAPYKPEDS